VIPLNQSYRIAETLAERPDVAATKALYEEWLRYSVQWVPHDLNPSLGPPEKVHVGRSYDAALALVSIDFIGLDVLELGARASFLGCYLTDVANKVHVTDLFGNRNMGDLFYWHRTWEAAATRQNRLCSKVVDMRQTDYPDGSFDVVLNISAIEHVPGDGDIQTMREMARIVRPGGYLVIGTDTSDRLRMKGGRYYDEDALYERLIEPSGCFVEGPIDLSWEHCDQSRHKSGEFDRSCCLFVLRKDAP